jgi:hypothetical protein
MASGPKPLPANDECPMTNVERMTNAQMTKSTSLILQRAAGLIPAVWPAGGHKARRSLSLGNCHSCFVLRHSLVLRHSTFVISFKEGQAHVAIR